jgi:hypothetical protein
VKSVRKTPSSGGCNFMCLQGCRFLGDISLLKDGDVNMMVPGCHWQREHEHIQYLNLARKLIHFRGSEQDLHGASAQEAEFDVRW